MCEAFIGSLQISTGFENLGNGNCKNQGGNWLSHAKLTSPEVFAESICENSCRAVSLCMGYNFYPSRKWCRLWFSAGTVPKKSELPTPSGSWTTTSYGAVGPITHGNGNSGDGKCHRKNGGASQVSSISVADEGSHYSYKFSGFFVPGTTGTYTFISASKFWTPSASNAQVPNVKSSA